MRFFNTAGPCHPEKHYMLPATKRLADENMPRLIEQEAYFVVHAPRQTGKTTTMIELANQLTVSGRYAAITVSMEVGAGFPNDIGAAERAILDAWRIAAEFDLPLDLQPPPWPAGEPGQRIGAALSAWARHSPRPLVIFLDEIDALQNDVLISVLRQLRNGYRLRPRSFPAALGLIGLRDIRDYKVASGGSDRLTTPSPFNISVRSITLRNFTAEEVRTLLTLHTTETGQAFAPDALAMVFELTQGQPWLVNVLAKVAVEELVPDLTNPVSTRDIDMAVQRVIERRQTHLDQLTDKLRQPRVRRVIEPILAGGLLSELSEDDREYVIDLGLVRRRHGGSLEIANPIYRDVIPRALSSATQDSLPAMHPIWRRADGTLDTDALREAFLTFWRQHGQPLLRTTPYHEIAPHLVMMAFLDRVVNGGGTIDREFAIGSGRVDLHLRYGTTRLAIELKVWRDGSPDPRRQGLAQLDDYLSGLSLETGWLVIFDQRSSLPNISERTTTESSVTPAGRTVTVIRA